MRETRKQIVLCVDTRPSCGTQRLCRRECVPGVFAVPVVELVGANGITLRAEQSVVFRGQRDVAEQLSSTAAPGKAVPFRFRISRCR